MGKAEEAIQLLSNVCEQFERYCKQYNGKAAIKKQTWDSPLGPLDVAISRGDVFEKASLVYSDLEIGTPPMLAEKTGHKDPTLKARVLEIHLFPVNPHIPKVYIELRVHFTKNIILAGGTDIYPYFPNQEDHDLFADRMQQLCKHHGLDYEALRKVRADFFKSKYRKVNVGSHAGIYFFQLEEDKLPFFKDMAETFFKAYSEVVEKRKNTNYSQDDIEHKMKVHGEWVQWTLLEDDGTKFGLEKGIPLDALLGSILPPLAKF